MIGIGSGSVSGNQVETGFMEGGAVCVVSAPPWQKSDVLVARRPAPPPGGCLRFPESPFHKPKVCPSAAGRACSCPTRARQRRGAIHSDAPPAFHTRASRVGFHRPTTREVALWWKWKGAQSGQSSLRALLLLCQSERPTCDVTQSRTQKRPGNWQFRRPLAGGAVSHG